jgi:HSP20 family protein
MALVKFSNGSREPSLSPFQDIFESFFNDSFLSDRLTSRVPAVNIAETEKRFHIELAAPGLKKDDFKINLDKNVLSISVEKKTENNQEAKESKNFTRREYSYTSFVRSFTLPDTVDPNNIEAEYSDGVLKIGVAKKEDAQFSPKQISIK